MEDNPLKRKVQFQYQDRRLYSWVHQASFQPVFKTLLYSNAICTLWNGQLLKMSYFKEQHNTTYQIHNLSFISRDGIIFILKFWRLVLIGHSDRKFFHILSISIRDSNRHNNGMISKSFVVNGVWSCRYQTVWKRIKQLTVRNSYVFLSILFKMYENLHILSNITKARRIYLSSKTKLLSLRQNNVLSKYFH